MISFARGAPAPECLDADLLADCARAAILRDPAALGYRPAAATGRCASGSTRADGVEPGRVVVTNGGLQGFLFYAEELLAERPGRVLAEAPTYDRPLKLLARIGAEVVAVGKDDQGLDPDELEQGARGRRRQLPLHDPDLPEPERPHALHGAPSPARRARGASPRAGARGRSVRPRTVRGEPPPSLHELEGGELVTYASSFSKTVAPGLRVGWVVAPRELAARLEARAVSTYISPSFLTQATVHEVIDRGAFEPNLERIRGLLRARRDAMLDALERELGGRATWSWPEGGYFLWLDLPSPAAELLERAEPAGVSFVRGSDFFPESRGGERSARLAFSYASPSEIDSGIATLASLIRA